MPRGKGKELISKLKIQSLASSRNSNILLFIVLIITLITPWWIRKQYGDILAAAALIGSMIFFVAFLLFINLNKKLGNSKFKIPKLLVSTLEQKNAPFIDATGARAGALLGDCLHDPLQSGGLGTPAHERITAGMIHKANKGVLFIDEVATLQSHTQQELLSALQEKGIDLDSLLLEFLEKREQEIEEEKAAISAELKETDSRYIPVKTRKILAKEHGTKCSKFDCKKPAVELHHTQRFALARTHDPRYLTPLCKEHHQLAHQIISFYSHFSEIASKDNV